MKVEILINRISCDNFCENLDGIALKEKEKEEEEKEKKKNRGNEGKRKKEIKDNIRSYVVYILPTRHKNITDTVVNRHEILRKRVNLRKKGYADIFVIFFIILAISERSKIPTYGTSRLLEMDRFYREYLKIPPLTVEESCSFLFSFRSSSQNNFEFNINSRRWLKFEVKKKISYDENARVWGSHLLRSRRNNYGREIKLGLYFCEVESIVNISLDPFMGGPIGPLLEFVSLFSTFLANIEVVQKNKKK
ncbi:hypothetical protein V1478_016281 [Vespula squamosa]|uniref:Uncharacterized protein n=1 Tax=Vespula squamosa TaxID=30214 RepID=A0ABD1ZZD2_VESSQ